MPPTALDRLVGSDAGRYVLSAGVAFAVVSAANVAIANVLGPDGKGLVSLLLTAALIAGTTATLGLELSLCRAVAAQPDEDIPGAALLLLVAALAAVAGGAGGIAIWVSLDSAVTAPAVAATVVAALGGATAVVSGSLLIAIRASRELLFSRSAGALMMLAATVVSLALGGGAAAVIAAAATGSLLTAAAQIRAVRRLVPRALVLARAGGRPLLASGLRAHAGTVIQTAAYRVDFFIVAALLSTASLGVYSVAVMLAMTLSFVPDALGATLLQRVAADGPDRRALRRALLQATISGVAGAAALAATCPVILPVLFGKEFEDAYVPLLLLLPGMIALAWWKLTVNYLYGRGHDLVKTKGAAVSAIVGSVLDLLLIPVIGLDGAALAASTAYGGAAAVAFMDLRRREGIGLIGLLRGRATSPSPLTA